MTYDGLITSEFDDAGVIDRLHAEWLESSEDDDIAHLVLDGQR